MVGYRLLPGIAVPGPSSRLRAGLSSDPRLLVSPAMALALDRIGVESMVDSTSFLTSNKDFSHVLKAKNAAGDVVTTTRHPVCRRFLHCSR